MVKADVKVKKKTKDVKIKVNRRRETSRQVNTSDGGDKLKRCFCFIIYQKLSRTLSYIHTVSNEGHETVEDSITQKPSVVESTQLLLLLLMYNADFARISSKLNFLDYQIKKI